MTAPQRRPRLVTLIDGPYAGTVLTTATGEVRSIAWRNPDGSLHGTESPLLDMAGRFQVVCYRVDGHDEGRLVTAVRPTRQQVWLGALRNMLRRSPRQ